MRHPLLQALAFALGAMAISTALVPDVVTGSGERSWSGNVFELALGEGRKILAYEFFVKADAYFHSGYYPTFFDQADSFKSSQLATDAGAIEDENEAGDEEFEDEPRDFIERIGRHFRPARHVHLGEEGHDHGDHGHHHGDHGHHHGDHGHHHEQGDGGEVREILPWLRLSASLDPSRVETYTTTAYWLRSHMNKVDEAEKFLREGLRHNPYSYEILFELGRIADENRKDPDRARRLWELALRRWTETQADKEEPDRFGLASVSMALARLAEREDKYDEGIYYLNILKKVSPRPELIQERIDDLKAKSAGAIKQPNPAPPDKARKPR